MAEKEVAIRFKEDLLVYLDIAKQHWLYFLAITFFILLISLSNVGEKYLFKLLLDNGALFVSGELLKDAMIQIIIGIAAAFLVLVAVRGASHWLRLHLINRVEGKMLVELKKRFFGHIVRLSHKFHSTHRTGSLIARMTRGGRSIEDITDFFTYSTIPLIIQLSVVCISLAYVDVSSSLVILVTMAAFILFIVFITRKQQKPKIEANLADDEEKGLVSDVFTNIDTIKYFGKEGYVSGLFEKLAKKTSTAFVRNWDYENVSQVGQAVIMGFGTAALLYFPIVKFLNGEISIGDVAFIYTLYLNVAEPMYAFMYGIRRFYESMADFQSLIDYGNISNEVSDLPNAKSISVKKGEIEFRDVSFTYHKKKVIDNFSLKIKPNEKIAIVGLSGSGKTTLVKLLYRFYNLDSGSILIDGIDITKVKQESLRSQLSIVPQEGIMFNDTILSNVAFSEPSASKEEVLAALKAAQLYEFIESLPEKENTIVGERGIKLSGGERQRLSIARAILANKKILVLDEATSSLDSQTEYLIQQGLNKLMKGRTSIVIAHRLSTILSSDKIVVISKGKIVEVGKHEELIKKDGIYKKLWNMQKGGYIEA